MLALFLFPATALAQTPHSKSDADINAIGQRNIGQGVNFFSLEKEGQLGDLYAGEVARTSMFIQDAETYSYVEQVAENVEENSDKHIPITIHLIDADKVGGFVLPGGHVYINRGTLLRLQNEGELASLIARGVAHTALRYETKQMTREGQMQIGAMVGMIFAPYGWAGYGTFENLQFAIPITELEFRRDAERAADYYALQYVYKSGYDSQCFLDFVQRLWGPANTPQNIPKAFSTYPPLPERLQALQKEVAEILPERDTAIVSTSAFQEFHDHLQSLPPIQHAPKPDLRHRAGSLGSANGLGRQTESLPER